MRKTLLTLLFVLNLYSSTAKIQLYISAMQLRKILNLTKRHPTKPMKTTILRKVKNFLIL